MWRTPLAWLDIQSTDVPSRGPQWPNTTPMSALLLKRPPDMVRLGVRSIQDAPFRPHNTAPCSASYSVEWQAQDPCFSIFFSR